MTAQQIHELLKQGECLTLECKRCENKLPNSLWETYSSFANSYGGYILLGIEEHLHETDPNKRFAIQGVANPDKLITDFWNLANDPNKINVNLLTDDDVQIVPVDGVNIIAIRKCKCHRNHTETIQETPQKSVQKSAQKSAQKIVLLIKDNADITTQEIADILGVNRSGVARHIKKLQEQGIIRRVGPDKGGHWEIIDK